MAEASGLSASQASTSPFASQVSPATILPATDVTMAQESQAPRAVSPNTLPSRPASAQGFRSPSSWFNRTSSSTSSGHLKHSLLDMVPSQPLNRPISSAPPSPASQLQPPTIPALEQLKQQPGSAGVAEPPAPSPVSPQTSAPKELAAELAEGAQGSKDAKHEQGAGVTDEKRMKKDRRMRKTEANMRWQLMRRLADISSDVELLNHEVARVRYEQSSALLAEEQKELSEQEEQQLETLQQKRLADLVVRQCTTILKSVLAHKWAFPFAKPVDVNIFKDYPNVIKQPMDFATIKAKVDSGAYKGPQHFFDDMKLVFSNARWYNPPGSDVNLMANGVEEKFDERWQVLLIPKLAEEEVHMRSDAITVRKQRLDNAQARQAKELEQHKLRLLGAFDNLHSRIIDAKTLAAAACKPVRQQDKEALLPALERLSLEQFEWAMSLVHARYPGLPSGPGEEMQFDITCLDSLALRQLMDLTQACARAAKMVEGGEVHVTWPCNPVGSGSRGHKPVFNKRPRHSTTPPTPCSAPDTFAYAPSSQPAAASTSAPHSALPEARQPTGQGAPALHPAPPAAQPAVHAAHAQVPTKPNQPVQLPFGTAHQLPASALHSHTSSLPLQQQAQQQQKQAQQQHAQQQQAQQQHAQQQQAQEQLAQQQQVQQQQARQQLPQQPPPHLQFLPQAPLPQLQATQMHQTGQSEPSAVATSNILLAQSGLASPQSSVAALGSTDNLQQALAASLAPVAAQTGSSEQPHAPMTQLEAQPQAQPQALRGAAEIAQLAEPAANRGMALAAPLQSSLDFKSSRDADLATAHSDAQPMDLEKSGGHAQIPLPAAGATQQAQHLFSSTPAASATLPPPALQQPDAGRALPAAHAQIQLQQHLDQLSTTISKSRSRSREPSAAAPGQAHAEHHAEGSAAAKGESSAAAIASNPKQAPEPAHPVVQDPSPAAVDGDRQQQQQPQGGQKSTAAASAVAPHQRTEASQDSSQDDEAKGAAHAQAGAGCAQSSAATEDSSRANSTDANAEASDGPEDDRASASPEAEQAVGTRRVARRRQAPRRQSTPTPLASRGAGAASRKGTGRGRGRAATPAARAAKQPPRRSTSRSTAGKRRRSPS